MKDFVEVRDEGRFIGVGPDVLKKKMEEIIGDQFEKVTEVIIDLLWICESYYETNYDVSELAIAEIEEKSLECGKSLKSCRDQLQNNFNQLVSNLAKYPLKPKTISSKNPYDILY